MSLRVLIFGIFHNFLVNCSHWNIWTLCCNISQLVIFAFDENLHQNFSIREDSASKQRKSHSRMTLIILAFFDGGHDRFLLDIKSNDVGLALLLIVGSI